MKESNYTDSEISAPPKSRELHSPPPAAAMGSVSLKIGDGTARFRRSTLCSSAVHLMMLVSVLTTNLFALYAFTSHPSPHIPQSHEIKNLSLISDHVSLILREISSSERKLHQLERDLAGFPSIDPSSPRLSPELHLFLSRHPLPLGPDSRSRIAHLVSSVSHSCPSLDLLSRFTSYSPFSTCPPSSDSALQLIAKGNCQPLPRRRCLTRLPKSNPPLLPFPHSLWPSLAPTTDQWIKPRGKNDFTIDHILSLASPIRLALDILGGAADFAAHMADRNVTTITITPDATAHRAAARGLIPLLITPAHALPFQDGVFDLVHASRALDEGAAPGEGRSRPEAMEFLMFDIDRVLRTGGLLWIDNYVCVDDERKRTVTKLVERFGYKKLKWVVGEKAGGGKPQLYLSAVLQKPARA